MFDHNQDAPWILKKMAKPKITLVNKHKIGARDQEDEQRAAKIRPQACRYTLQQFAQRVGLHLTLEDGQVDQACEEVVTDKDDRCQDVEPSRKCNQKRRHCQISFQNPKNVRSSIILRETSRPETMAV